MTGDGFISVRDWRRKPPLRLRVAKKLDIHSWPELAVLPFGEVGVVS